MKNKITQAFDAIKNAITPITEFITDQEQTPEVLYEIDSVVDGKLVKLLGVITDEPVDGAKLVKIPDENGTMVQKYFKAK